MIPLAISGRGRHCAVGKIKLNNDWLAHHKHAFGLITIYIHTHRLMVYGGR